MTPIERAVAILQEAGYRPAPQPIRVASTEFEFDAVLSAERSLDLIVIVDTAIADEKRMRRHLQALSRALDVIGSRRTLTAVLVGPEPRPQTLQALARSCRVLPVGVLAGPKQDDVLKDWLAVLLPLQLPSLEEAQGDWRAELESRLNDVAPSEWRPFVQASDGGAKAVQETLRARIDNALAAALEDLA